VELFASGRVEMVSFRVTSGNVFDGLVLKDLPKAIGAKVLICAVSRDGDVTIPSGNFIIRSGDELFLTGAPKEIKKTFRQTGLVKASVKNAMIAGGSRTAYYLAKMLTGVGNSVKIIEKQENVCSELSDNLPKAVIIHGDGASQELLLEEGLLQMDAFVSLTGMDEENILMSIFASSNNVSKVIAKVNSDELTSIASNLGLDCLISPKKAISDVVIRYARALENSMGSNIETLYTFMDGSIEAIEFNVKSDSKLVGIPISKLNIKKGILIAGILRNRKPKIPTGNDVFIPGDRVIIIAADMHLNDFQDIVGQPVKRDEV